MSKMEYYLQIAGKIYIEHPLDESKDYSVALKRVGIESVNRQVDGEKITYKAKNLDEVTLIGENKVLIGKPKKGSQSQKLRMVMKEYYDQQEAGNYEDFEAFYQEKMGELIEEWKDKLM
ncbi:MAG: hypothetical protein ACOCQ4_01685 [bacterium]